MSVLACDRNGCENIMCDRLSPVYGYICGECFEELIKSGAETSTEEFMKSIKLPYNTINENAALARFSIEFPMTFI